MKKITFTLLLSLLAVSFLYAEVTPSSLFSDHMVLQRGVEIPVWGKAAPNESVAVTFENKTVRTKADASGNWMVRLPKEKAGGPYVMKIVGSNIVTCKDVYVGDVWLCGGQSNMDMTVATEDRYWCGVKNQKEEVANANYPLIRDYDVPFTPDNKIHSDPNGKWEICSPTTVKHWSAVAYFLARDLYKHYKIPMGVITSCYGASTAETWISKEALEAHPDLKPLLEAYAAKFKTYLADSAQTMPKYRNALLRFKGDLARAIAAEGDVTAKHHVRAPRNPDPMYDQHSPYVCYNGMIAPLIPYAIKGMVWYQGESNGPSAKLYREIMETLVADWRTRWKEGNIPFLYVQLANFGKPMSHPVENSSMMTVREAQLQNLSIPNTAMVVAIQNAVIPMNIHPKNKQAIGYWLSLAARAKAYGEHIQYSGPVYKKYKIQKNKIRLYFDHVGKGLVAKDGKLTGFAICGKDKHWVWGNAHIDGKTIVVSSPEVAHPIAVRYCWGTNPPASLSNKAGLWCSYFRTDNF